MTAPRMTMQGNATRLSRPASREVAPAPTPRRGGPSQKRADFLFGVARAGSGRFSAVFRLVSLAVGVTIASALGALLVLPWPWAVAVVLAIFLLVAVEGAYQLWSVAYDVALTFMPTWERIQERAETFRAWCEANESAPWPQLLPQYIASHR
jgi:hypothetical protein